ncbi:hypothetical protein JK361_30015 [Streptomyces sp. 5-8]|uniref:Transposase n=1 Tax=Streptomyces musisoli TaxID=2802280 RepID=A0ABS1P8R8_9ACTN|nr:MULTISPECIES: hypothetical protein [Streptomyces]MBL1108771.1 hypothetical protein [Streptomyces musisoli]MBY8842898.1 hypothetical protein [Streptomyces sp. SP2-10]
MPEVDVVPRPGFRCRFPARQSLHELIKRRSELLIPLNGVLQRARQSAP